MKKLITISGTLTDKGSTANKLAIKAAEEGKNLTEYISDLLDKHVKN